MNTHNSSRVFMTILISLNLVFIIVIGYLLFLMPTKYIARAERIDIKNKNGTNRVVISNEEYFPDPVVSGKEYKRQVVPAGLLFYDKNGNERGGIAISENSNMNSNAISFDYHNADAIGIYAKDNLLTNYFKAGLTINDKDISGKPGYNINRIDLASENGNAALVIKDANEITRIMLKVDSLGNPSIEMYDSNGNVSWKR